MNKLEKLKWDTVFFGKNVFSINTNSEELIKSEFEKLPVNSVLYVFSSERLPFFEKNLVDKKVTFTTTLNKHENDFKNLNGIILYSMSPMTREKINYLSIESSRMSRFRVDPKINNSKVDELYIKWVDKAILNISSHEILGIEKDDELVGMVLVKKNIECHHIEIIAVHPDYYRQGIAGKLIKGTFQNALNNEVEKISVVTQLDNVEACNLYKKHGFKIDEIKYLYHLHK